MLVEADEHRRAEELLKNAASKLERAFEQLPKHHDRNSFIAFNRIFIEQYLDLAYRSLATLSEELGNAEGAQDWNQKLDKLRG